MEVTGVIDSEIPIAKLLKALKAIDPELRKSVVRRVKEIGKPVELAIKGGLPQVAPLSGMINKGRLGWGIGKAANSTTLAFKATPSKTDAISPLLSVKVNSAATAVADIAGRKSQGNTASGRAMIARLNAIRSASRYVWPAGEKALPGVIDEIQNTIDEVSAIIEKEYA